MRIVSLVPSLTETVAEFGLASALVGVTTYCAEGAPASATRVGGTKNPDSARIVALRPDLVLGNDEENRAEDLDTLRAAGLAVHTTFPRRVADVAPMLIELGKAVGAPSAGAHAAQEVDEALGRAAQAPRYRGIALVWRKPWMAAGSDTYLADLLRACGVAAPDGLGPRWPRVEPGAPELEGLDVVVLPDEPYAFGVDDLPAVHGLVGDARSVLVDGRLVTWHGPRTAMALRTLPALLAGSESEGIHIGGP